MISIKKSIESVDGDWSEFGDWSDCSMQCGGGSLTRRRTCSDPVPANGGADCEGDAEETQTCNTHPCPSMLMNASNC